jgi:hypothetical protein
MKKMPTHIYLPTQGVLKINARERAFLQCNTTLGIPLLERDFFSLLLPFVWPKHLYWVLEISMKLWDDSEV